MASTTPSTPQAFGLGPPPFSTHRPTPCAPAGPPPPPSPRVGGLSPGDGLSLIHI